MHFWTSAAKLLSSIVLRSEKLLHNIYLLGAGSIHIATVLLLQPEKLRLWPLLLLSSYFTSLARIQRIFCPPASTLHSSYSISITTRPHLPYPTPKWQDLTLPSHRRVTASDQSRLLWLFLSSMRGSNLRRQSLWRRTRTTSLRPNLKTQLLRQPLLSHSILRVLLVRELIMEVSAHLEKTAF